MFTIQIYGSCHFAQSCKHEYFTNGMSLLKLKCISDDFVIVINKVKERSSTAKKILVYYCADTYK